MRGALNLICASACAALASAAITSASINDDQTHAQFWQQEWARASSTFGALPDRRATKATTRDRQLAVSLIANEAKRQGVPVRLALRVAKVESSFRCDAVGPMTRHGRHYGPLQIRPSSAARFGYRGGSLANCGQGLTFGMAHLADCWRRSGSNEHRAARCHVAGPGGMVARLNPKAERYAQSYVAQVQRAQVPAWAGSLQVAWNW